MNKRVQDADGFRGSVRYEGPIQGKNASTVYWGVDWDDPSRGKHSGESGGVRYFEAAHPTSGSFVLPEKVSLGIGILEALHERYMQSEDLDSRAAGRVGTSSGSSKPIQLVGVRKIQEKQDLGVIGKVSVEGSQISHIGNEGELYRVAPNIVELNLGFNLLSSWSEVLKLSTELPQLEHLVLSGNILTYDVDVAAPLVTFPTVHVLVMHYTRTSWGDLLRICRDHFPALRELHAASNQLTDDALRQAADIPSLLEVVDLSHNQVTEWSSVESAVGTWPRLHTLSLNGNNLAQIQPPAPSSSLFLQLASLSLSNNAIADWASIDALNSFPSLEALRLTRNPLLMNVGSAEARMLVVARCASLKVFNSSDVRLKEHQDAEHMYLKRILHEKATVSAFSNRTTLLTHHPRFPELQSLYPDICAAHDAATTTLGATTGPAALAKSLAKVTFVPMSMNATTMDTMVKALPLSMKVAQVKLLVEKKYGLLPTQHHLSFRASKKAMPMPLDDDNGELGYFGVQEGGELLINDLL
ncbi:hypothetical protein H310_13194 [Aphanomyces invadans]|uniref:CAP-Gly domain-containing protein n=1 Tax=Aphanomyces invadans TaxID=157072 RepID=A0A024TFZ1_9STRA|nr:hypothetical protein H310_13194 [Aphanomyces invadans]ETV92511.1 hypothetical protein H310_13194 [Aphanomyces invadans]|eukprot:XP_008878818.1 hypothetical protein H310_13194 [Aphanomyces invadans]